MRYLRNSLQIKQELAKLFSGLGRKMAIVGFVGYNAVDHLPSSVTDLSVVCWPKAGGTHPDGVRRLIDKGISVYFCDRLHQKIYWRERAGLIVGSANLSDNALGGGGLHEFGVYCEDEHFDIDQVLAELDYVPVTPTALAKLDVEHAAHARHKEKTDESEPGEIPTFLDALQTKHPKKVKLVTWSERRENSVHIRTEIETHFGTKRWIRDNDVDSNSFQIGDFVLQVGINDDGFVKQANAHWLLVDHIMGKRGNYTVVQVNGIDRRTPPPFVLDKPFRRHLKEALNNEMNWGKVYDKSHVLRPTFVQSLKDLYRT
jgi:hypothetical protein